MRRLLCQNVPSDDGVVLMTDVYLPNGPGPFPALLARTPYNRSTSFPAPYTDRGYAYVIQDTRGKFGSDGTFRPLEDEARDGQATVAWIARQPWCNGRIGLQGASYSGGITQIPAATGRHEALRCFVSQVSPANFFRDWIRYDGCFALGNIVSWIYLHNSDRTARSRENVDWESAWAAPTIEALEARLGVPMPTMRKWIEHDCDDEYWTSLNQGILHESISVAGLHIAGWFDHLSRGQLDGFRTIRARGATEFARNNQKLLIGPWGHRNVFSSGPEHSTYGDWNFGETADLPVPEWEMMCYDYYLNETDTGYSDLPPVYLFLMGENRWMEFEEWPPPQSEIQSWYLASGGAANTMHGDGSLSCAAPPQNMQDAYSYDPANPVPGCGGPVYWGLEPRGPVDQQPILDRNDVLVYRGAVLIAPLCVIGEILLDLVVTSSARDTDFVAKFCVEEPSGAITVLTIGSLRCKFRESWSDPKPLTPNEPTIIQLHLGHTAYTFPAGSRPTLLITSSEYPRILPHANTMAAPWHETNPVVARNAVRHGPNQVSRVQLPVIQ